MRGGHLTLGELPGRWRKAVPEEEDVSHVCAAGRLYKPRAGAWLLGPTSGRSPGTSIRVVGTEPAWSRHTEKGMRGERDWQQCQRRVWGQGSGSESLSKA